MRRQDAVNSLCPWSGKPVQEDSLTEYRGKVIGFCNPGCRDKFAAAPEDYPEVLKLLGE
ncbi:YHS domain-containing protein [Aestuariispira ectoiniformans]|uniref:YHS domain-containing protein n=1 Tax=Aestuariispira ectoiniformans TaxID=2775080 RepID=UPI00223AAB9E|nr:YHS domain-containing protein [Aestuariispira ectoiniformans]